MAKTTTKKTTAVKKESKGTATLTKNKNKVAPTTKVTKTASKGK